jgi:hypothetical protein
MIPFDKDGTCEGPNTRDDVIAHAREFSDVFLFSHGWNNDWTAATRRYEDFINGFVTLRHTRSLPVSAGYNPLAIGIFWPSQALEWFDSETGPEIAAADPAEQDRSVQETTRTIRDIGTALPPAKRERFYTLAQARQLEPADARELAALLASLAAPADEGVRPDAPTADDLLAAAVTIETPEPDYETVGTIAGTAAPLDAAAGFGLPAALDPRNILKPFTVWQMKDRAGVVGAHGVSSLLVSLLGSSKARVHLIGHSYGCKVVMSALSAPATVPRKVESALLLQAAVSQYAFAANVPGRDVPGGFRGTLERVQRPILATFSSQDAPLHRFFQLAVRRHDDLGELQAAAGAPPKYGALGGYGPQASGAIVTAIASPVIDYDLSGTGRIVGVDSTNVIKGHGDISQPATWWAAYQLASAHMRYPVSQEAHG